MKTFGITLAAIFIFSFTGLFAQEKVNDPKEEETFTIVEVMPQFHGGEAALMDYLIKNIKYPEQAKKDSITGKVIVRFVVDKAGKVTDCTILRSANPLLDAEAVRVVGAMPAWTPGKQRGKVVSVYYTLPINFALK